MNISSNHVVLPLLALMLALTACSGLTRSDQQAMKTWWLEPYEDTPLGEKSAPAVPVRLSVAVVPGLDTERILTLADNAELNHYAAARWAENLPELLTSLVGRSLESSGRYEMVSHSTASGQDHCDLHLEMQEFFAHLDPSGQTDSVRLAVYGHLQCESAEDVLLQVKVSVPVYDQQMSTIVAAFQKGTDDLLKYILKNTI